MLLQVRGRADARQHQQLRTVERAGTDDDGIGEQRLDLAGAGHLHADRAIVLEQDAVDLGFRHQPQIGSRPHRVAEMAVGGGAPRGTIVGGRQRRVALLKFAVHIGNERVAVALPAFRDSVGELVPLVARDPAHGDRSGGAMILVGVIEVGFQLAKIRQNRVPVPTFGAKFGPRVEVGGRAAQRDLPVDGGSAAHQLALIEEIRLTARRRNAGMGAARNLQRGPKITGVGHRPVRVSVADVLGDVGGAVIRSGLDHQYLIGRVLAETRRQRASGRAAAGHDMRWAGHPDVSILGLSLVLRTRGCDDQPVQIEDHP